MKLLNGISLCLFGMASMLMVSAQAQHQMSSGSRMSFDAKGLVMNSNDSELPLDCSEIASEIEFTVHVGTQYAAQYPGTTFAMSHHELSAEPCSLITITLVNEDEIRHQWMLHGLPRYLYPEGMFHLEANGGESRTGSFIVPSDHQTYLIHCDMTQHMEKGLKAQLVVGRGSGNLWSIPGISQDYKVSPINNFFALLLLLSMLAMSFLVSIYLRK